MNLLWKNKEDIEKLKNLLDRDQVVLASGDTVIGLYAPLTHVGYEALNSLKQRSGKPYLLLIESPSKLSYFVDQVISEKLQRIINMVWPGPVTLIFKAKKDLPDFMKDASGTIALRIPDHEGLLQLLKSYNGLFSTSANIHTEEILETSNEVNQHILKGVGALCLDDTQSYSQKPSTILDCSSDKITILREGALDRERLTEIGVL